MALWRSTEPFPSGVSKAKLTEITLEIVLKAYNKKKAFIQKSLKPCKDTTNSPLLTPVPLDGCFTLGGNGQEEDSHLGFQSRPTVAPQERQATQHFSFYRAPNEEAKCLVTATKRLGVATHRMEAPTQAWQAENPGALLTLNPKCRQKIASLLGEASREDQRLLPGQVSRATAQRICSGERQSEGDL